MSEHEYPPAREPTPEEWQIRNVYLSLGRSVSRTAMELGLQRTDVLRALSQIRYYRKDLHYDRRYQEAKQVGLSDSDANLHAQQEASFNLRKLNGE